MKSRDTEIREAIQAADQVLMHLDQARECLKSAGNWGIADMIGGGFFMSLMKRGKMSEAEQQLTRAREAVRNFAAELRDVNAVVDIHIVMDDFLGLADLFFDNVIADWMMQSRIGAAQEQVSTAIAKVRSVKASLQGML